MSETRKAAKKLAKEMRSLLQTINAEQFVYTDEELIQWISYAIDNVLIPGSVDKFMKTAYSRGFMCGVLFSLGEINEFESEGNGFFVSLISDEEGGNGTSGFSH